MRYLLYARVSPKGSSWDGGETTCADQLRQCREFILARDRGATFVEVTDELRSGGTLDRPGIAAALAELRSGRAAWDCIVVRHLDRLTRSLADAMPLLRDLQEQGKSLICITQNLDLSGPAGRAMLHMLLVFAQFEREMGSERTKSKMMSIARAGGWPPGCPPKGYVRGAKKDNTLQIDPVGAVVVRDMFRSFAAGATVGELARRHRWPKSTVSSALRNPCYVGKIYYAGQTFDGLHEPIVTPAEFAAVQELLPNLEQGAPRRAAHRYPYLLPGIVKCECGRTMTAASARGRHGGTFGYYQCTDLSCKNRVSAADLEQHVLATLSKVATDRTTVDAILAEINAERDRNADRPTQEKKQVRAAIDDAKDRAANLMNALATGLVTADNAPAVNEELSRLNAESSRLKSELERIDRAAEMTAAKFEMAAAAVRDLANLGDAIRQRQESGDTVGLTTLILSQVQAVVCTDRAAGLFEVIPFLGEGFVYRTGWRPHGDSNPGYQDENLVS